MKTKIILLMFYISCVFSMAYSQQEKTYTFYSSYKKTYKEATRKYINDSVFYEYGFFYSVSKNDTFCFKISNGKWYLKTDTVWQLFFDSIQPLTANIGIWGIGDWSSNTKWKTTIKWEQTSFKDEEYPIFVFEIIPIALVEPILVEIKLEDSIIVVKANEITVPRGLYYFTYKDGIIAIESERGFLYKRRDKIKVILSNVR
ncbi:MAG: hypothetical protein KBA86_06790 [Bacteroidales bacterium]|nr:hypothetical protein [Bacteroidales bacterium]